MIIWCAPLNLNQGHFSGMWIQEVKWCENPVATVSLIFFFFFFTKDMGKRKRARNGLIFYLLLKISLIVLKDDVTGSLQELPPENQSSCKRVSRSWETFFCYAKLLAPEKHTSLPRIKSTKQRIHSFANKISPSL